MIIGEKDNINIKSRSELKNFLFSHTKTRRHKGLSQGIFFVILCAFV